jgi:hypothetical protein
MTLCLIGRRMYVRLPVSHKENNDQLIAWLLSFRAYALALGHCQLLTAEFENNKIKGRNFWYQFLNEHPANETAVKTNTQLIVSIVY